MKPTKSLKREEVRARFNISEGAGGVLGGAWREGGSREERGWAGVGGSMGVGWFK